MNATLRLAVAFGALARAGTLAAAPVSVKQIIPGARIAAIGADQDRFLWFGTERGAVRYDGDAMVPFRGPHAPDSQVYAIAPALGGGVWLGTRGRHPLLRVRRGIAVPLALDSDVSDVFAVVERGDELWLGTNAGLVHWRDGSSARVALDFSTAGPVRALLAARDGAIWIGHDLGLARLKNDRGVVVHRIPGKKALGQSIEGRIWAGCEWFHAALVFDESGLELARIESQPVHALLADPDGAMWLATERGLSRSVGLGQPEKIGLGTAYDGRLRSLARDADGTVWVGTASSGALQVDHHPMVKVLDAEASAGDAFAFSLAQDATGQIWASMATGLVRTDGTRTTSMSHGPQSGLPFDLRALAPARGGGIWAAGARSGVYRLADPADRTATAKQIERKGTRTVFEGGDGSLWFGWEAGGLARAAAGSAPVEVPLPRQMTISTIVSARSGGLWLATMQAGLLRWRPDHGVEFHDPRSGLASPHVLSVIELASGVLCVGTEAGGLDCQLGDRFVHYGHAEGLTDERIGAMIVDHSGAIWLGTTGGILRLDAPPESGRRHLTARTIGLGAGLRSVECSRSLGTAAVVLHDGALVFATTNGIVWIDPVRVAALAAPAVIIDRIILNGDIVPRVSENNRWPTGAGNLEVHYAAPRFLGADALSFRYRLDGQDPGWVSAGTRRVALYTNLQAGRYQFTVGADDGGSSTTARFAFVLQPPFHRTRTFFGLALVAASGILWTGLRLRRRQTRARRADILAERSRLARDLHDTVEQSVVAVRIQLDQAIEGLGQRTARSRTALRHLERAVELLVHASSGMRTAIFALRPTTTRPPDFSMVISNIAGQLLRGTEVNFHLRISDSTIQPSVQTQPQIVGIISAAITNAIKHGQARTITVSAARVAGNVEFHVADDGRGFDQEVPMAPAHYGIMGMRERAQLLGGTLTVESSAGAGTTVTLAVRQQVLHSGDVR